MRFAALIGLLALVLSSPAIAAGFAQNENFIVFAQAEPSEEAGQAVAELVLERAEQLRSDIAEQWLGRAIPPGLGRSSINVNFRPGLESALTWAKDRPDRTLHAVYLRTTPDRVRQAIEEMLPHEIAHVVLATRFPHPNRLPVWVEEGIASRYDDSQRMAIRQDTVSWWVDTQNWPAISSLFGARNLHASDTNGYATAASVVEFLLSLRDKQTLLAFAQDGQANGWDKSLKNHYQIDGVQTLQNRWQAWLSQAGRVAVQFDTGAIGR